MLKPTDNRHGPSVYSPEFALNCVQVGKRLRGVIVDATPVNNMHCVYGCGPLCDIGGAASYYDYVHLQACQDTRDVVDEPGAVNWEELRRVFGMVRLTTQQPDRSLERGARQKARFVEQAVEGLAVHRGWYRGSTSEIFAEGKQHSIHPFTGKVSGIRQVSKMLHSGTLDL